MPKISIIVPVYKAEKYIRRCVDSLLVQTFTDFELILVDDGSPDGSGAICDNYLELDNRVKVIHKLNGGVSSARNVGLDNASGEWVTFVDSDDYLLPTFLEGLFLPITNGELLDFVHGGCLNVKDGKIVGINQTYEYYVGGEPSKIFAELRGLIVSKLFRLDKIRRWSDEITLRFDEHMKIAEDLAFTFDYLSVVEKYAFVTEMGYCYSDDNCDSATKLRKCLPYETELLSFRHLFDSIMIYKTKHNIANSVCELRYVQLGNKLQNVILSLYRNGIPARERLMSLNNDFPPEELMMLKYANSRKSKCVVFSILNKSKSMFDLLVTILHKFNIVK